MPSADIIEAAHNANPHGCGFVTPSIFYKGLNFETFKQHLAHVAKEEPCIIHFRLATHGSIKRANCHPFREDDIYMAHNGIFHNAKCHSDMTDSETVLINIISPVIHNLGWNDRKAHRIIAETCGGSRIALMYNGEIRLFGRFNQIDGCYFSNLRFTPYLLQTFTRNFIGKLI